MSDMGSARKAREEVKRTIGSEPWCVGIGVEREDGVGFIVRVSVSAGTEAIARAAVPERVGGVLVKIVENDA
jgi:hypothetical protein